MKLLHKNLLLSFLTSSVFAADEHGNSLRSSRTLVENQQHHQRALQECNGSDPSTCGCDSVLQADYRGIISVTTNGLTCQRWDSQSPHRHDRTPSNYPDKGLESNLCRNPDNEPGGAWCYTDSSTRWAYCNVPSCVDVPPPPAPDTTSPTPEPTVSRYPQF